MDTINYKLDNLNRLFEIFIQDTKLEFEKIDNRFEKIDNRFEKIDNDIVNLRRQYGKMSTDIKLEFRRIDNSIIKLNDKVKPFISANSKRVESEINQCVFNYYKTNFISGDIENIKQLLVSKINQITLKSEKDLILYCMDIVNFTDSDKKLTELDGIFSHNYKDLRGNNKYELVIVEAKFNFTLQHLKDKLNKFLQIKKLINAKIKQFNNLDYYNFIKYNFAKYDKIIIFLGAFEWDFDYSNIYVYNNIVYTYDEIKKIIGTDIDKHIEYGKQLVRVNDINQLFYDNVIYCVLDRPDIKSVFNKDGMYLVDGEYDMFGGDNNEFYEFIQ